MRPDAIAVVLAGGRGRRLGDAVPPGGKARLPFAGETLLERTCRAIAGEIGRVVIVAAPGQPLPPLPPAAEVIHDRRADAGPLAAVADALEHVGAGPRTIFLCGCDVPLLQPGVIRLLLDTLVAPGVQWVVPHVHGHPQVLVSALVPGLLPRVRALQAAGGGSLRALAAALAGEPAGAVRFLPAAAFTTVDPTLASFLDVDTPADLAAALRLRIPPSPG